MKPIFTAGRHHLHYRSNSATLFAVTLKIGIALRSLVRMTKLPVMMDFDKFPFLKAKILGAVIPYLLGPKKEQQNSRWIYVFCEFANNYTQRPTARFGVPTHFLSTNLRFLPVSQRT